MIADPINLKDLHSFKEMRKNIPDGGRLFGISMNGEHLSLFAVFEYQNHKDLDGSKLKDTKALWTISIKNNSYRIGYEPVSKESLFDYIRKNYPDHYEWLLWNQEWR